MSYFLQYYALIIFILFASILSGILIVLSYIFDSQKEIFEKTTSYECGFEPFGDARNILNIQFYIVAILFIIFDLEVAFLLPWVVVLGNLGIFSFWLMIVFLIILTVGFVYEWKKGALNWI